MVDTSIAFDRDGKLGLKFAASPTGRVVVRAPPAHGSQAARRGVRYGDVLCSLGDVPLPRVLPPALAAAAAAPAPGGAVGGNEDDEAAATGDADAEEEGGAAGKDGHGGAGAAAAAAAVGTGVGLSGTQWTLAHVVSTLRRARRPLVLGFATPQGAAQRLAAYGDAAELPPSVAELRRRRRSARRLAALVAVAVLLLAVLAGAARDGSGAALQQLGLPRESGASVALRQLLSSGEVIVSGCTADVTETVTRWGWLGAG